MGRYDPKSIDRVAAASEGASSDAVVDVLLGALCNELDWAHAAWWDVDSQGGRRCVAAAGALTQPLIGSTLPASEAPAADALTLTSGDSLPAHLAGTGARTAAVAATSSGVVVELIAEKTCRVSTASREILHAAVAAAVRARRAAAATAPAPAPAPAEATASPTSEVMLNKLTEMLPASWDEASTYTLALTCITEVLGWSWGAVWLWRPSSESLRPDCFHGDSTDLAEASATLSFKKGEGLIGTAQQDLQPHWAPAADDSRAAAGAAAGLTHRVAIPITIGEIVAAVVECWAPQPITDGDLPTLKLIQSLTGSRVQQIRADQRTTDLAMLPTTAGVILDAMSQQKTVSGLWSAVAEALTDLIWADVMAIVYQEDGASIAAMPEDHADELAPQLLAEGASESLPGQALDMEMVINDGDLGDADPWSARIAAEGFSTAVCVPIVCQRLEPVVLVMIWRERRAPDSYWQNALSETGRVIAGICDQVAAGEHERAWAAGAQRIMKQLNQISAGDFSGRITGEMPGDLDEMRNNVHRIADTVGAFKQTIAQMTDACAQGNLDFRSDATNFEGAWNEVIVGLNGMLEVVGAPIHSTLARIEDLAQGRKATPIGDEFEGYFGRLAAGIDRLIQTDSVITDLTERIASGDLSANITPRSEEDRLMGSLVEMVATLERFRSVIDNLIQANTSGDLNTRADETEFKGAFSEMVAGMNAAIAAVAGPTQEAIRTLSALADGGQPPELDGSYAGAFERLAHAINTLLQTNGQIADIAEQIATGDLTVEVRPRSEQDRLLNSLARMVTQLNDSLRQIDHRAAEVSGGSTQVEQASQALSYNAVRAAENASEMKCSAEDLQARTIENAERAARARDYTRDAAKATETGSAQMNTLLTAMRQIEEESSRIGNIVRVIDEIAFQTNLLALNAAVEAARAGTHGKGFAVVAEEVRNLAARSAVAAKEIGEVITTSMKRNAQGVEAAEASATSLQDILQSTREASDLANEIASASEEQSSSISSMRDGLSQLDEVIQSNSAQAEEMAAAATEMSGQVNGMQALLGEFSLRTPEATLPPALAALPPELLRQLIASMQARELV